MKADYNDVSGIADNSFGLERLVTFPGEDVSPVLKCSTTEVVLGHGLSLCSGHVLTSVAGKLRHGAPLRFSTETDSKYYSPSVGDNVVAVIEDKLGDFYIRNIFTGGTATMSRLAFDGATKRNKPELKRGDVVYARVVLVDRNCDVELSCLAPVGPKKDWSSGEAIYGELSSGLLERVPVSYATKLLQPDNVLLDALSRHLCFEVAIGMNGAVWLRTSGNRPVDMVVARNALLSAEGLDAAQTVALVEELVRLSKSVSGR